MLFGVTSALIDERPAHHFDGEIGHAAIMQLVFEEGDFVEEEDGLVLRGEPLQRYPRMRGRCCFKGL